MENTPYSASYPEPRAETSARVQAAAADVERQVKGFYERLKDLASDADRELRGRPYVAAGAAAGLGFGVGAFFGSVIVRTLLLSVGGYAVSEFLRKRAAAWLDELNLDPRAAPSAQSNPRRDPVVS